MMKNISILFALVGIIVVVRSQTNPPREIVCTANQWKCANKRQCIPKNYLCDKTDDCIDGSDEQNCGIFSTKTTMKTTQKLITNPAGTRKCGVPAIQPATSNSRIVGGVPAKPHSWPWQVALMIKTPDGKLHLYCAGSIINETTVITAAHCTDFRTQSYRVVAGEHDMLTTTDGATQTLAVRNIFASKEGDIAIFMLAEPLVFNDNVSPICLPKAPVSAEQNCYGTGWGDTQGSLSSTTLNQVRLPIISQAVCSSPQCYSTKLKPIEVCAGFLEGGKDTCQGDSGGPLTCQREDKIWYLDGVTSWGKGCAAKNKPGVYARVYSHLDWIRATIGFQL